MEPDWMDCVREVAEALLAWREQGGGGGEWQGTQFKARADRKAHDLLAKLLASFGPDTPLVSEEDSASHVENRPARYWLIDPLDGTASYAHGFDGIVCQAALMDADGPVEAVVIAPALAYEFHARKGAGAWGNGRPLAARPCAQAKLIVI